MAARIPGGIGDGGLGGDLREAADVEAAGESAGVAAAMAVLDARQRELVARHVGLVGVHLRTRVRVGRQPRREREYDDLFQAGCLGLIRAAQGWDPQLHGEFPPYALPRIRASIHTALYEGFSLVHVPIRVQKAAKNVPVAVCIHDLPPEPVLACSGVGGGANGTSEEAGELVRHAIRGRFERAIGRAMVEMRARAWRRRNPCSIMARIAAERLAVPNESERTALRAIARDFGISSGRASDYERQLTAAVESHFRSDPHLPLLIQFAAGHPLGFDMPLQSWHRQQLAQAELNAFARQFETLDRTRRAEVLFSLIERTTPAMDEVARNLYRMVGEDAA